MRLQRLLDPLYSIVCRIFGWNFNRHWMNDGTRCHESFASDSEFVLLFEHREHVYTFINLRSALVVYKKIPRWDNLIQLINHHPPALVAALPPMVQVPLAPKSRGTMKPCFAKYLSNHSGDVVIRDICCWFCLKSPQLRQLHQKLMTHCRRLRSRVHL